MKFGLNKNIGMEGKTVLIMSALLIAAVTIPGIAFAETTDGGFTAACENVAGFFGNFQMILKAVSVGIVTIAIVFAGYQIAFAHKRISDVAPILIGGLLIGGAATIAVWFVGDFADDGCEEVSSVIMQMITPYSAA